MPYAATYTLAEFQVNGEGYTVVSLTETGITGASDEKEITGLPALGTVTEVHSTLAAGGGAATTVQPRVGESTGSTSVYSASPAAASSHSGAIAKVYTDPNTGQFRGASLFWSARANGTADSVTSQITIKHGHHP